MFNVVGWVNTILLYINNKNKIKNLRYPNFVLTKWGVAELNSAAAFAGFKLPEEIKNLFML